MNRERLCNKALEIRFALLDCYLVDIRESKKLLEGTEFDIKPSDGATIFGYFGRRVRF